MVHSTYRFALLTFNLLCSIEAMKESFVGGDSMVDAYGAEDKGQKLQVSLGEHDTGHGETEDEANGEDVAFVEVTASGALKTIARPRNSSLVEAVQADEAELAGEAEQDEDAEEADEVDGAKLTGEAENAKEAENDQPGPGHGGWAAHASVMQPLPNNCFECISQTNRIFCKDSGKGQCCASSSCPWLKDCEVQVQKAGQGVKVDVQTVVSSPGWRAADIKLDSARPDTAAKLAKINFDDCGFFVGNSYWAPNSCSTPADKCKKRDCERFCAAKNGGKTTYCKNGGAGWQCGDGAINLGANRGEKDTCASCIHTKKMSWCPKAGSEVCVNAASMPANCKKSAWTKAKYDSFSAAKKQIPASCKPESLTSEEFQMPDIFGL